MGPPLSAGVVEIRLLYAEAKTDPVPVLVPDCDHSGDCAPSTIREGVVVIVRAASATPAAPPGCGAGSLPLAWEPALQDLVAARTRKPCAAIPSDLTLPIARVDLAAVTVDTVLGRPLVYSAPLLQELLVCLAEHVGGAAQRVLRYVSGDGQQGAAGDVLDDFVVELVDRLGNPIAGSLVQFTVVSGGGAVARPSATTGADGRASTTYTLGAPAGTHEVKAAAVGSLFTVAFHATRV
jgi:hypothetical protein